MPTSDDMSWREEVGPMPHQVHKHGTPEYEAYRTEWYRRINERERRLGLPEFRRSSWSGNQAPGVAHNHETRRSNPSSATNHEQVSRAAKGPDCKSGG
jgi:hypothetical protein